MQDRQRQHAVLGVAEEAADARRADLAGLQVQQARDHLQVVLHPVMDLAQHVVALLEAGPELGLAAGDRRGHRAHALADRRQLRPPRALGLQLHVVAARHAIGEVADVAQRPHAPAVGAEPDRQQRRGRAPARPGRSRPSRPAARRTLRRPAPPRPRRSRCRRAAAGGIRRAGRPGRSRGMPSGRRRSRRRAARRPAGRAPPRRCRRASRRADRPATRRSGRQPMPASRDRRTNAARCRGRTCRGTRRLAGSAAPSGSPRCGVTRLASWAPTVNLRVSRTSRKISRSENPMPTAVGALEQRAVPSASVTKAEEYSLGNFCSTCAEIGLAAVDVGRAGVRAGAQPDGILLAHRHQQAARGFDQLAMAGDHQVGGGGHRLGLGATGSRAVRARRTTPKARARAAAQQ